MKYILSLFKCFCVAITLGHGGEIPDPTIRVPALINFQGKLSSTEGLPLPSGELEMEFRIWDGPNNDATLIWGSHFENVVTHEGSFNVLLGGANSLTTGITGAVYQDLRYAFEEETRFIGITILNGTPEAGVEEALEIAPRQKICSTAFVVEASNGFPVGTVLPFAGPETLIVANWLPCDGASYKKADYAELFDTIGEKFTSLNSPEDSFQVPDLRGRTAIATGHNPDSSLTEHFLAETPGFERMRLKPNHLPDHIHGYRFNFEIITGSGSTLTSKGENFPLIVTGTEPGFLFATDTQGDAWGATDETETVGSTETPGENPAPGTGPVLGVAPGFDIMYARGFSILQPSLGLNYIIRAK